MIETSTEKDREINTRIDGYSYLERDRDKRERRGFDEEDQKHWSTIAGPVRPRFSANGPPHTSLTC